MQPPPIKHAKLAFLLITSLCVYCFSLAYSTMYLDTGTYVYGCVFVIVSPVCCVYSPLVVQAHTLSVWDSLPMAAYGYCSHLSVSVSVSLSLSLSHTLSPSHICSYTQRATPS